MKKVSFQIGQTALVIVILWFCYRMAIGNVIVDVMLNPGFEEQDSWGEVPSDMIIKMEKEGIVAVDGVRIAPQYVKVRLKALKHGTTNVQIWKDGNTEQASLFSCEVVGPFSTIVIDQTNFTGLGGLVLAIGVFLLCCSFYFLQYYRGLKGNDIYSYLAIFSIGMVLFAGAAAICVIVAFIRYHHDPFSYSVFSMLASISNTSSACMMYLTLPMLVFAIAMIISNIELLRHERMRFANVLGILIPIIMIVGEAISIIHNGMYFAGSFEEYRIREVIQNVYDTIYVYFECMLAASVICGIRAVKHRVARDKDYIIILGCKFRQDGSLTPLLKGRCDAAIRFWRKQKEETGKIATMVPSGGQGADESMPEAEAMARYLVSEGIPEDRILRESEAKNTYQNMAFSRKLIEERTPDAKVIFATTNYHVFRSGLWASLAGLSAEGIGGVTKWWFWPNAFMRECIGLMANRKRQEAILLVLTIVISVVLSYMTIK